MSAPTIQAGAKRPMSKVEEEESGNSESKVGLLLGPEHQSDADASRGSDDMLLLSTSSKRPRLHGEWVEQEQQQQQQQQQKQQEGTTSSDPEQVAIVLSTDTQEDEEAAAVVKGEEEGREKLEATLIESQSPLPTQQLDNDVAVIVAEEAGEDMELGKEEEDFFEHVNWPPKVLNDDIIATHDFTWSPTAEDLLSRRPQETLTNTGTHVDGVPFHFMLYPRGNDDPNSTALFLAVSGDDPGLKPGWNKYVHFRLECILPDGRSKQQKSSFNFDASHTNYGFRDFIPLTFTHHWLEDHIADVRKNWLAERNSRLPQQAVESADVVANIARSAAAATTPLDSTTTSTNGSASAQHQPVVVAATALADATTTTNAAEVEEDVRKWLHEYQPFTFVCSIIVVAGNNYSLWRDMVWNPHMYDSKRATGMVGLFNQGATCYMNSLLQTLFHTRALRRAVFSMPTVDDNAQTGVALAVQRLFYYLQTSPSTVETSKLTKAFGWDAMEAFVQHDVQEFLRKLMDNLEEKMKGTAVEGQMGRLFKGTYKSFTRCVNVDYESSRSEEFYDVQLNVKGMGTLERAFEDYIKLERIDGENQYQTDDYGKQDADRGIIFEQYPPVLYLHLKRFVFDLYGLEAEKINERFEYPERINLDPYLSETDPERPAWYRLHSVLVHKGVGHGGHYIGYVRPEMDTDRWYVFDDENVYAVDAQEAIEGNFGLNPTSSRLRYTASNSNAYMLVYIRESELREIMPPLGTEAEAFPAALAERFEREEAEDREFECTAHEEEQMIECEMLFEDNFRQHHSVELYAGHWKPNGKMLSQARGGVAPQLLDLQMRARDLLEDTARDKGVTSDRVRIWPLKRRRGQGTRRAERPVTIFDSADFTLQDIQEEYCYTGAQQPDEPNLLRFFVEVLGADVEPVMHPWSSEQAVIHLKYFDSLLNPCLRYIGQVVVHLGTTLGEMEHYVRRLLDNVLPSGIELAVWEEEHAMRSRINALDRDIPLVDLHMMSGDIVVWEKAIDPKSVAVASPLSASPPLLNFQQWAEQKAHTHSFQFFAIDTDDFSKWENAIALDLDSREDTYDSVCAKLAVALGMSPENGTRIRLWWLDRPRGEVTLAVESRVRPHLQSSAPIIDLVDMAETDMTAENSLATGKGQEVFSARITEQHMQESNALPYSPLTSLTSYNLRKYTMNYAAYELLDVPLLEYEARAAVTFEIMPSSHNEAGLLGSETVRVEHCADLARVLCEAEKQLRRRGRLHLLYGDTEGLHTGAAERDDEGRGKILVSDEGLLTASPSELESGTPPLTTSAATAPAPATTTTTGSPSATTIARQWRRRPLRLVETNQMGWAQLLPLNVTAQQLATWGTLRLELTPEDQIQQPLPAGHQLVPLFHFARYTDSIHGQPILVCLREGEKVGDLRARLRPLFGVGQAEFASWRLLRIGGPRPMATTTASARKTSTENAATNANATTTVASSNGDGDNTTSSSSSTTTTTTTNTTAVDDTTTTMSYGGSGGIGGNLPTDTSADIISISDENEPYGGFNNSYYNNMTRIEVLLADDAVISLADFPADARLGLDHIRRLTRTSVALRRELKIHN